MTAGLVAQQLGLLLATVLAALIPALWFTRFDTAGGQGQAPTQDTAPSSAPQAPAFAATAAPRTPVVFGHPLAGLCAGELRVLVKGQSRWWWLGLVGLTLAALVVGANGGSNLVLLLAWVWPVLVWSRLGAQAHEHDVHLLTGAGAAPKRRLLAEWAAGAAVAALAGIGPLLRMLLGGDLPGVAAWAAGAAFIPALALLLGTLGRSARLFQLVYLMLWYAVANGLPAVDVMGAVRGQAGELAGPHPLLVFAAAAALIALTLVTQEIRHARR